MSDLFEDMNKAKGRPEFRNTGHWTPNLDNSTEEAICGICGDKMKVERAIMGATGFAEAMSGKKHLHDHFYCPNNDKMWHIQVKALITEGRELASKRVENMYREEAEEILRTRKETKKVSIFGV